MKSKALQVQGRIRSETTRREKTTVDRKNLCNRILIKQEKMTISFRQVECLAKLLTFPSRRER